MSELTVGRKVQLADQRNGRSNARSFVPLSLSCFLAAFRDTLDGTALAGTVGRSLLQCGATEFSGNGIAADLSYLVRHHPLCRPDFVCTRILGWHRARGCLGQK